MATAGTIGGFADEVNTQLKANRDLITQGAMTEAIVKSGIDASIDIDTILARLTALVSGVATGDILADKVALGINSSIDIDALVANTGTLATNSIAPVSGRLPVNANVATELATIISRLPTNAKAFQLDRIERVDTGEALTQISTMTDSGTIAPYLYLRENGTVDTAPGAVRLAAQGRAMAPATGWNTASSDSEWLRRFYRLMFPGGIFRSTVTAVNAGNTDLTGLELSSTNRIVITRILIQSATATPNTAVLRAVGTTSSNLESYRLAGDGAGVSEVRTPHSFIRGAAGANISINLAIGNTAATPVSVYVQIQWYLEDTVTGLPVS